MQGHHVAVGLNGTPVSFDAVRWAAWASQETRVPLRVVHVFTTEPWPGKDRAEFRTASESWHRSRATGWLRAALGDSDATRLRCPVVLVPATTTAADEPEGETTRTQSCRSRPAGVSR